MLEPSVGWHPTIATSPRFSLRNRDTPMMVPVVPIALTKWVTLSTVSFQISGPVVS